MLDRLDALEDANPAKNKRSLPRVAYRKNDIAVRIYHPGGSMTASFVGTRNLSAGGVSFLYHGFLHKNTKVEIVLHRRVGADDLIRGTVQHCALVDRQFHLIGVRFDQKILPKLYLDPSHWGELDDGSSIDRSRLEGTVLHLDDQEIERMLVAHFLKGTKIKLISSTTVDEALKAIKAEPIDCILCDLLMEGVGGEQAIAKFREGGYSGPIGLVTAETNLARVKKATDAGASAVLSKPFDSGKLTSLLAAWLNAGSTTEEPILSTLNSNAELASLVEQYVGRLHNLARELRKGMEAKNLEAVRQVCQMIKGTGAGFGFAQLSDMARDTVQCLDASSSLANCTIQVQQLESACYRSVFQTKAA